MEERQAALRVAMDFHPGLDVRTTMPVGGYLLGEILDARTMVIADRALELLAGNVVKTASCPGNEGAAFFPGKPALPNSASRRRNATAGANKISEQHSCGE
jgi:hypothetical protein